MQKASGVDVSAPAGPGEGLGRFQVVQYALALVPVVFVAMSQGNFVFAAAPQHYRCILPECESPAANVTPPSWWPAGVEARCSRPGRVRNATNASCSVEHFTNETEACHSWVYETTNTIVSEFDLACHEWKRTLVGTVHNIGVLISMPVMGYVSDRWGRRTALIISSVGLTSGALKTLARGPSAYLVYLGIELVEAAIVTATYTTAFVLLLELVGNDKRIISSAVLGMAITLGNLLLALVVWLVPYWRHFQLLVYCPAVVFLSYIIILEESLRWLLTNGRTKQAEELVLKMEKWNGKKEGGKREGIQDEETVAHVDIEEFNLKLLFSSVTLLKRVMISSWWWFSAAFIYYGLAINSVTLPGVPTANYALVAIAAVPGDLAALVALDSIGRKRTQLSGFLICGVCCVANAFIPVEYITVRTAVYLLGSAAITMCFNAVYIYTSELMPTSARGSLMGACSMLARVGSILAPQTPLLSEVWVGLPTVLFGCAALVASTLTLLTPETLRRELPDTVAQAEAMR